jgi:hypothetical protein
MATLPERPQPKAAELGGGDIDQIEATLAEEAAAGSRKRSMAAGINAAEAGKACPASSKTGYAVDRYF